MADPIVLERVFCWAGSFYVTEGDAGSERQTHSCSSLSRPHLKLNGINLTQC